MIMLDNTVVNVALPTMQKDLHVTLSSLEWVVIAYALTFASLLITGGKLADLYGRRRIFGVRLGGLQLRSPRSCAPAGSPPSSSGGAAASSSAWRSSRSPRSPVGSLRVWAS